MKKLLTGFTLAEILITLAIIGLVARVTLPTLMSSVHEQQTTTSLAKAINTLALANKQILAEASTETLSGAGVEFGLNADDGSGISYKMDGTQYINLLSDFLDGSKINTDSEYLIDGDSATDSARKFMAKDGIVYMNADELNGLNLPYTRTTGNDRTNPHSNNGITLRQVPRKYDGSYVIVAIDIDSYDGANRLGEDQFIVLIDNKGAVIPYGSFEYTDYAFKYTNNQGQISELDYPVVNTALWKRACDENSVPTTVAQRAACTGSIVDNNYKIIYNDIVYKNKKQ